MARATSRDDFEPRANGRGRHNGHDRSSDEIERDLEATRRDIGRTLDELEQRLTPGELFDQAVSYLRRSGGGEFTQNLGRGVRDNPMPVLVTSIGLGWLMWASSHPRHDGDLGYVGSESSSSAREALGAAAEKGRRALERAGHARSAASERGAAIADRARRAGGGVREGTRRALSQAERALHEQPVALGVAAFALASLAAAMLPPTETEDEVMGESRDRTMKSAAESAIERGREGAQRAADTLEEKASEAAESVRERAGGADRERTSGPATRI